MISMHKVQYVVLKSESGQNWMCVEHILQKKVGVGNGERQLATVVMTVHDKTLILTVTVERSGDRIPVGARFSAPVQTGSEAHPASYIMGYRAFPGGKAAGAWR